MARNSDLADFGSSASAGAVLEEFCSPCDGSAITVRSGTYTVGTVSGVQNGTTTFTDLEGSSIDYTPPSGAQTVVYTFSYMVAHSDAYGIGSIRLMLDNDSGTATEVTNFRTTFGAENYIDVRHTHMWAFHIGGSYTAATGRVATWTSARTIKLQVREYGSSNEVKFHLTSDWEGGGTDQFSQPVIGIKALA